MIFYKILCLFFGNVLASGDFGKEENGSIAVPDLELVLPNGLVYSVPFNAAFRKFRGVEALANVSTSEEMKLGRVIGGIEAANDAAPYQVGFMLKSFGLYCSGSLYRKDAVITAAHCFFEDGERVSLKEIVIAAGKTSLDVNEPFEELRTIRLVYTHEQFDPRLPSLFDIAVVLLESPLCLNPSVQPIRIAEQNFRPKGEVSISGWGYTLMRTPGDHSPMRREHYSSRLKRASIKTVSRKKCIEAYASYEGTEFVVGHDSVICAGLADGTVDTCQGDSGGPLTCTDEHGEAFLCGIISTGIGCGLPDLPSLYTNVGQFHNWIVKTAGLPDAGCEYRDFVKATTEAPTFLHK